DLDPQAAACASMVLAHVERAHGWRLDYARVDLLQHEGRWVVGELELIEPGLYLDVRPGLAGTFADGGAARPALPSPACQTGSSTLRGRVRAKDRFVEVLRPRRRVPSAPGDRPSRAACRTTRTHRVRNRRSHVEAHCFQRGGPPRPRAGDEHPRRRGQG